ncbi:hypothetical protein PUN28_011712 [Cardiocondyla obscurior]|uniref:Uncharacterized protein n=1 Tax=Cardiocondyla obscurior TaxID=286306 RepID=A0AAW2FIJ6_9HYME
MLNREDDKILLATSYEYLHKEVIFLSCNRFTCRNTQCGGLSNFCKFLSSPTRYETPENFLFRLAKLLKRRIAVTLTLFVTKNSRSRMTYSAFAIQSCERYHEYPRTRLVNPWCTELKRIAFEIGNAFDRPVTRPGYRR